MNNLTSTSSDLARAPITAQQRIGINYQLTYTASPRRFLPAPKTRRFIIFELQEKTNAKKTLARTNDTNDSEPARTRPCACRYSAAPMANYYLTLDQTFWPIYRPGAGYLLTIFV